MDQLGRLRPRRRPPRSRALQRRQREVQDLVHDACSSPREPRPRARATERAHRSLQLAATDPVELLAKRHDGPGVGLDPRAAARSARPPRRRSISARTASRWRSTRWSSATFARSSMPQEVDVPEVVDRGIEAARHSEVKTKNIGRRRRARITSGSAATDRSCSPSSRATDPRTTSARCRYWRRRSSGTCVPAEVVGARSTPAI